MRIRYLIGAFLILAASGFGAAAYFLTTPHTVSSVAVPALDPTFPSDFPIPPGAKLTYASRLSAAAPPSLTAAWTSDLDVATLETFYSSARGRWSFTGLTRLLNASAVQLDDTKRTYLGVTVNLAPEQIGSRIVATLGSTGSARGAPLTPAPGGSGPALDPRTSRPDGVPDRLYYPGGLVINGTGSLGAAFGAVELRTSASVADVVTYYRGAIIALTAADPEAVTDASGTLLRWRTASQTGFVTVQGTVDGVDINVLVSVR
jgi:hypothetical protein